MSRGFLDNNYWTEEEIYPSVSLQTKDLDDDYVGAEGNVPLSRNQRKKLEAEQKQAFQKIVQLFRDYKIF